MADISITEVIAIKKKMEEDFSERLNAFEETTHLKIDEVVIKRDPHDNKIKFRFVVKL